MARTRPQVGEVLRDAFDIATRDVDAEDLEVVRDVDVDGRVAAVTIPERGGALVLNDDNAMAIDEALAKHDWETGTARLVAEGIRVSVWEVDC